MNSNWCRLSVMVPECFGFSPSKQLQTSRNRRSLVVLVAGRCVRRSKRSRCCAGKNRKILEQNWDNAGRVPPPRKQSFRSWSTTSTAERVEIKLSFLPSHVTSVLHGTCLVGVTRSLKISVWLHTSSKMISQGYSCRHRLVNRSLLPSQTQT